MDKVNCSDFDILHKIQDDYSLNFRRDMYTMAPWGGLNVNKNTCDVKYDVYNLHGVKLGTDYRRIQSTEGGFHFGKSHSGTTAKDIRINNMVFNPIIELARADILRVLNDHNIATGHHMQVEYILHVFPKKTTIVLPFAIAHFSVVMSYMDGVVRKAYIHTYEAMFEWLGNSWKFMSLKESDLSKTIKEYRDINNKRGDRTYCYYDASQDIHASKLNNAVYIGPAL